MILYTGDSIVLAISRIAGGAPVTGLVGTVKVVNTRTDATLLATTNLAEAATPGLYRATWSANLAAARTDALAIFVLGGRTYHEFFVVDDLRDRIDNADGRVT